MPVRWAHSPQSETAMSPMPIASVTVAPQAASRRARSAGSPPPGSPATRRRRTLDRGEVEAARLGELGEVQGVGRGQRDDLGREPG